MKKISKLKLTLILIIIKEVEPNDLLRQLSFYTSSSAMQVIYMLEDVETRGFIRYINGEYELTNPGFSYLQAEKLTNFEISEFYKTSSKINTEFLSTYIPNKL